MCSECGNRTQMPTLRNGMRLCEICAEITDGEPKRGKRMAMTWDDYQGQRRTRGR